MHLGTRRLEWRLRHRLAGSRLAANLCEPCDEPREVIGFITAPGLEAMFEETLVHLPSRSSPPDPTHIAQIAEGRCASAA
jgi:hypothetical protein